MRAALRASVPVPLPGRVALERLARRWGIAPWELERDDPVLDAARADWLLYGIEMLALEAEV